MRGHHRFNQDTLECLCRRSQYGVPRVIRTLILRVRAGNSAIELAAHKLDRLTGFEPAVSCVQGRREQPDFPISRNKMERTV